MGRGPLLVSTGDATMSVLEVLGLNTAVVLGTMLLLWLISLKVNDASIVDMFWGAGFVLIAWTTYFVSPQSTRASILAVLTTLWGLRLSTHLVIRNLGKGEDRRYTAMRDKHGPRFWWVSLITVFALQGIVMLVVSLPVQIGQLESKPIGPVAILGMMTWAIGFSFESIADYQLTRFRASRTEPSMVLDSGLWRYSRHPNYFGNALIWWGLFLIGASWSTGWTVVSPIVMTFLLCKVSGVPLLEKDLARRSAAYQDYIERTSSFVPLPPRFRDAAVEREA